jgi:hypothetical protein
MNGLIVGSVLVTIVTGAFLSAFVTTRLVAHKINRALSSPPAHQLAERVVSVVIPTLMEEEYLPKASEDHQQPDILAPRGGYS